jgi:uncharacterized membrane-anchored protein YjiN (DUF445 family)
MSVLPLAAAALVGLAGTLWAFWFYPRAQASHAEVQLAAAKRRALLWLVIAAACFVGTFAAPTHWLAELVRSGAEAAMVGAIADWIAVAALFRRIPGVGESDLIAKQKDTIGDELAGFVKDKFLDAESLATLIRRHDLGQDLANWLTQEANTQRLSGVVLKTVSGLLHLVEEERVQKLLKDAARTLLREVDLSRSAGQVLDVLTADERHQELLDQLLEKILEACNQRGTREVIAENIVKWLRTEHRFAQRILPTETIGAKGSQIIADNLGTFLREVQADRGHKLRREFDRQVHLLVERLQDDPAMRRKAEEIKQYLVNDDQLARYAGSLWSTLSGWLHAELASPDSQLHRNVAAAGAWLGRELADDPELRRTLNVQIEAAARNAAPEFADYLTRHIRDTVHGWDARQMSHQVELALGARLQKIRLNGTGIGCLLGLLLYAAEWAGAKLLTP